MNIQDIIDEFKEISHEKFFTDSTVSYLSSLPPALEHAAYLAAVLRWFNADVISGILKDDVTLGEQRQSSAATYSPGQLCKQLQELPFTEEYPGRGYSFHELTRKTILAYLWEQKNDFYLQLSSRAVEYFSQLIYAQNDQRDSDEIERSQLDRGYAVELAYHYILVDAERAVEDIDAFVASMLSASQMEIVHDLLEALDEHAKSGRLLPEWEPFLGFWKLQETYGNSDYERLEKIAQDLLRIKDTDRFLPLKASSTWYLADGMRLAARYDEAQQYFNDCLRRWQELENDAGILDAVIGMGYLATDREKPRSAIECFNWALSLKVKQLRVPIESSEYGADTALKENYPRSWHRRVVPSIDQTTEKNTLNSKPEKVVVKEYGDATDQETRILYFIELDIEQDGIENDNEEDEARLPEWPVEIDVTLADIWFNLGLTLEALDDYDTAMSCGELATQMFLDLGNLTNTEYVLQMLERLAETVTDQQYIGRIWNLRNALITESIRIGDKRTELTVLMDQAASYFKWEKDDLAREKYKQAYAIAESLKLDNDKAVSLEGLARMSWIDGDYAEAAKLFKKTLEAYQHAKDKRSEAWILIYLGDLNLEQCHFERAIDNFTTALETYSSFGSVSGRFDTLLRLSTVAQKQGANQRAFDYLKQMLELAQKDEGLVLEARALAEIGKLYLLLGNDIKAKEAIDRALDSLRKIGRQDLVIQVLLDEADIYADIAEYTKAIELTNEVIEIDSSNFLAYRKKGWATEHLGQEYALACQQSYEKAAELVPDNWWTQKGIALALKMAGDHEAATEKYRWIIGQIKRISRKANLSTLAWCYYHVGDFELAEATYRQVIRTTFESISDYFDLALVLMCQGKYTEALQQYTNGISRLNQTYPIRRRLGYIYVANFDLQEQIRMTPELARIEEVMEVQHLLKEARKSASRYEDVEIELQLDNADRANFRASVYAGLGYQQAAIAEYSGAIGLDPHRAIFYANRAQAYAALQQPAEALTDLTKAIELEPQNADRYYARSQLYMRQKQYSEALADIDQAIELRPEDTALIEARATIYFALNREKEMLADLARIIELMPDSPEGYLIRANYYVDKENYQKALKDYDRVVELQPDSADYLNIRANLFVRQRNEQAALADYSRAIELKPEVAVFYANRAQVYAALQQPAEALTDLTKAIELEPQNADRYYARSQLYMRQKQYSEALADIDQAIELRPEDTALIEARATIYFALNREKEMLADLARIIELMPDSPEGYVLRAGYYTWVGNFQAAADDYTRVIGLERDNYMAFAQRGRVNQALRKYKSALSDMDRAIELQPKNADFLVLRGGLHTESGNYQFALDDYTQAIQLKGDAPELYVTRAKIYTCIQSYEEALVDLKRSVELKPDIGAYYHFRALAYIDIGDYDAALSDLHSADKLDQGTPGSICYNLMWRGLIYQLLDRQKEATEAWIEAKVIAERLPDRVNQLRLLALANMFLGDMEATHDHYESLFKQNPGFYHLHMQSIYLQRAVRLLPYRTDIAELVKWLEKTHTFIGEHKKAEGTNL